MSHPRRRHTDVLAELLSLEGARIVDIGCGSGALVRALTKRGADVTGIEPQTARLAEAQAEERLGREHYYGGTAEALPLGDASRDAAIFFNSLHHVPVDKLDLALAEANRVLVPGGRLCVVEPLAEGSAYEAGKLVDDERAVRAAAYAALQRAAASPAWRQEVELFYDTEQVYADFEAACSQMLKVDPKRRERLAELRESWSESFHRLGRQSDRGWVFSQPMRANLLVRR